jgi:hypothetical protein
MTKVTYEELKDGRIVTRYDGIWFIPMHSYEYEIAGKHWGVVVEFACILNRLSLMDEEWN